MILCICLISKLTKIKGLLTMKLIEREIKRLKKEKKAFNKIKFNS